jgi:hypothetical protein
MSGQVAPAQPNLDRTSGPDVHCQLAQPGAHMGREPDLDLTQRSTEMLLVELPVQGLQPVKQGDVSWPGLLAPLGTRPRWSVLVHRKRQELPLGQPAKGPRNSRV